ncbi:hypothetical protein T492DRAFT_1075300 [Pavlovales sp. CCMP2436]|nr:hypothetical protein T492DRAFT_1075300 [Pavlovales sp. CCMP2436]
MWECVRARRDSFIHSFIHFFFYRARCLSCCCCFRLLFLLEWNSAILYPHGHAACKFLVIINVIKLLLIFYIMNNDFL